MNFYSVSDVKRRKVESTPKVIIFYILYILIFFHFSLFINIFLFSRKEDA